MADLIRLDDPYDPNQMKPLLRPLEVGMVQEGEDELLVLSDPLHLLEDSVMLPTAYLPILQMLDGSRSTGDLAHELVQQSGNLEMGDFLRALVSRLDELLLLDSPKFREEWRKRTEDYRSSPVREAALAGISYPAPPAELRTFLQRLRSEAEEFKVPAGDTPLARALIVPHIDLGRGGATMSLAYMEWESAAPRLVLPGGRTLEPELVVAFGTGHSVMTSLVVPTLKDYLTPLGRIPTNAAVVGAIEKKFGEAVYSEEIAHREEHSLEFQAIFLADLISRGARLEWVPLLCGSFHPYLESGTHPRDDSVLNDFVQVLRDAIRETGLRVRYLAGVDFSHVGQRFGDKWELNDGALEVLEEQDRGAIEAALSGDADTWYDTIAAHGDSTHICGFSSVYLMLRVMGGGTGRLLRYEQSPEAESQSVVTYASVAFELP